MKRVICCASGCLVILLAMTGCADTVAKPLAVEGRITLDGKPLKDASVAFNSITAGIPVQYRYKAATTDDNGVFEIKDVIPAEYMVTLNQGAPPVETAMAPTAVPGESKLEAYGTNSPLRAKVGPETTKFSFDLKAAGQVE